MNYTYKEDAYITYTSSQPDLHVRVFLHERLNRGNSEPTDIGGTGEWTSEGVSSDKAHGGVARGGQPLIMARQEALDGEFRGTRVYFYSVAIPQPKPGHYVGEIVAWGKDTIVSAKETTFGPVCDREKVEFRVEHSPIDRILCMVDEKNITVGTALEVAYQSSVSEASKPFGGGNEDWVVSLSNFKDGTKLRFTYKKGYEDSDVDFMGMDKEVTIINGKVKLQDAPYGIYLVEDIKNCSTFTVEHQGSNCNNSKC